MALHWFSPPVKVAADTAWRGYAVTNVERAAEFLFSWKNLGQGPAWRAAVATCMSAIKNEASVDEARAAFEVAAREADRLLR